MYMEHAIRLCWSCIFVVVSADSKLELRTFHLRFCSGTVLEAGDALPVGYGMLLGVAGRYDRRGDSR